jgi:hypothetical protein
MPKLFIFTKRIDDTLSDDQRPARPEGAQPDPLGWRLGGATPVPQRPGQNKPERRREQTPPRPAADVRRRHNPSSRFRG